MVLLGGLEFVVGGYLVHKHYKNKNEKKRLEEETQQRRHHTFPGAAKAPPQYAQRPYAQHHQHQQTGAIPQQKYACYAQPQPLRQPYYHAQFQHDARPQLNLNPPSHTQSFDIPRRPVPQHQGPPPVIQPLSRTDSCATLSRMPIANGYRPDPTHTIPPRRQQLAPNLTPIPQPPYSNHGFSVSTPALEHSPITPMTPLYGTGAHGGRQTIDDNWETYAGQGGYAPSVSTALGERIDEDDPPPPYRP